MLNALQPILPPAWLGILGGGQLGRMYTQAAQSMGFKVCVLDPDPHSPAGAIADKHLKSDYTDQQTLVELATICSAVSTEFENVPAEVLDQLESLGVFVAPNSNGVSIAQNRITEKAFFIQWQEETQIPPAPYSVIEQSNDLSLISASLLPGILKTASLGYDGKGQVVVNHPDDLLAAWQTLQLVPCVLEKKLPLAYEVSALVARGYNDQVIAYPVAENVHVNGVLHTSTVPACSLTQPDSDKIINAATAIIRHLNYVGVLCIEFFILKNGDIMVNEMAPRPHNSGHYSINASVTSQFEQQVRCMARLPLGSPRLIQPTVMLNLLGDEWFCGETTQQPRWDKVLANPCAKLHLYGKQQPRKGRKMGHINFIAPSLAEAQTAAEQVALQLNILR